MELIRMGIQIRTTNAQIGIQTTNAKLEIQQPKADVQMKTQHARVEIESEQAKVQIDQSACFAEAGLKNYLELTKHNASFAKQRAQQGIARIVRQGNEFINIQNKTDAVARQAEENAFQLFEKDFNVGLMPKSRPKISFTEGKANIKPIMGKVEINVNVNKPIVNYRKGNVEVYLKQKNSINIEYTGKEFNLLG